MTTGCLNVVIILSKVNPPAGVSSKENDAHRVNPSGIRHPSGNCASSIFLTRLRRSSEYKDRYVPQRTDIDDASKRLAIPRIYSTIVNRPHSFHGPVQYRADVHASQTQPNALFDPVQVDHIYSFRRNANVPRAYFHSGRVPDPLEDQVRATPDDSNVEPAVSLLGEQTV